MLRKSIRTLFVAMLVASCLLRVAPVGASAEEEYPSDGLELEEQSVTWLRLWGQNAYDTMAEIAGFWDIASDGSPDTVIVATGNGYWDALAASGLAGTLDCPVLITPKTSLADQTKTVLKQLAPQHVLVMGGAAAVSNQTLSQIKGVVSDTQRVYGKTAVDTAIKIYNTGSGWSKTCIVATSNGYWDALSIVPYAYASKSPIFLTGPGNKLTSDTVSAIKSGSFTRAVIVGGNAAVSAEVEGQLASANVSVTRLSGKNALETSAKIAQWELGEGMGLTYMGVATTNGYWDALTGASLCGATNSVLVLANVAGGYTAIDAVYDKSNAYGVHGYVFGGRAAISEATMTYLESKGSQAAKTSPKPLEIVDSGWVIDHGYMHYVIKVHNPNEGVRASYPKVDVVCKDGSGAIISSDTTRLRDVKPDETVEFVGFAGNGSLTDKTVPTITVTVEDNDHWYADTPLEGAPYSIGNVNVIKGEYSTAFTGELTLNVGEDYFGGGYASVGIALRDSSGKIVGCSDTTVTGMNEPGQTMAFEIDYFDCPDYATYELFAY